MTNDGNSQDNRHLQLAAPRQSLQIERNIASFPRPGLSMEHSAHLRRGEGPRKPSDALIDGCVQIVTAYVGNNSVPAAHLPKLITQIYQTLLALKTSAHRIHEQTPAVDPRTSVTNDYIICLEDGRRFKSLKRHLRSSYGLTPEEYRRKWGLDPHYPMVAPNYARYRSELAKLTQLGTKKGE